MTVTNTVTETEHLTPLRSAVEHINWNTLYQQKMALEEVSDMLYAKRKEDDTFGKASDLARKRHCTHGTLGGCSRRGRKV